MPTWWEIEVGRLAIAARLVDEDELAHAAGGSGVTEFLRQRGLASPAALEELLRLAGPVEVECIACRTRVDVSEREPLSVVECPGCSGAIAVPRPESWAPRAEGAGEDPLGLLGEIVDGIRFDRLLERRKDTAIYRGLEVSSGRTVAAKASLEEEPGDPDLLRREIRLMLGLSHEHLLPARGLLVHRGRRILVMDFVDGLSASRLVRQSGGLSLPRAGAIVRRVAQALNYLHRNDLVHRDVKPSNIMLGLEGEVFLADLDLVERIRRKPGAPGGTAGTPAYMPPEVLRGESAGPAADVYALGATLHHLLSGRAPYGGDGGRGTIRDVVLHGPVPLRRLRPLLPEAAFEAVERLMARRAGDRPASGAEVDELLAPLVA